MSGDGGDMTTGFTAGEAEWRARLGTLRQIVRQELVARQLAAHLPAATGRRPGRRSTGSPMTTASASAPARTGSPT